MSETSGPAMPAGDPARRPTGGLAGRSRRIRLADEADVAGFRQAARQLLREGVEPGEVEWQVATAQTPDLFGGDEGSEDASMLGVEPRSGGGLGIAPVHVPAFFVPLCERAALHADPGRFGLLYRLLWRLVHEPGLRGDALDPDRLEAEKMARMVRRDMHKMTAFVRFRSIGAAVGEPSLDVIEGVESGARDQDVAEDDADWPDDDPLADHDRLVFGVADPKSAEAMPKSAEALSRPAEALPKSAEAMPESADAAPETAAKTGLPATEGLPFNALSDDRWHVAWFEPVHHIVAATAPFFARRFAQMKWAILTPERCVRWDGQQLAFGPGASRSDAPPADAGEQLWLTYYAHIFNPARLKLAMMQKEMPRRYWHNLPEAVLIQPLTAASRQRSGEMVIKGGSEPVHRRPAASIALRIEAPANIGTAAAPTSLSALGTAIQACRECPIGAGATQAVPGIGLPSARLMLVGEQPGDQEDLRGLPFVGPAGQLLDRAFAHLGWPRDAVYLTNAVKHFKYELRGKRRIHKSPSQREASACLHWLETEIDLVAPKALVALGATAARALMGRPVGVTSERGQWLVRADGLKVLIALHPSALLRMEPEAREPAHRAWLADLALAASYVEAPA